MSVQHQVRDIETLIAKLTPAFHAEAKQLKRKARRGGCGKLLSRPATGISPQRICCC
ncbi:MAG: hypothetical protein LBU76_08540 [Azoarcus sp.]|nr:hypothetical protein [Azoarcus sp.]